MNEDNDQEVFYDYSPQRKQFGIQVMKNGMFVGAPIWVATEEEAKNKVEELQRKEK